MNKPLVIIGNGGHAISVITAAISAGVAIAGYVDKEPQNKTIADLKYLGADEEYLKYPLKNANHICALGDNLLRQKIQGEYEKAGLSFANIIHPKAVVESNVQVGKGVFIGALSYINADVQIGDGAIINNGSVIEHNCQVDSFAHIAPGSVLTGNVRIGECCLIGANSTIIPGVRIGLKTVIGAGSVVLTDIPNYSIVYGNPATIKEK